MRELWPYVYAGAWVWGTLSVLVTGWPLWAELAWVAGSVQGIGALAIQLPRFAKGAEGAGA